MKQFTSMLAGRSSRWSSPGTGISSTATIHVGEAGKAFIQSSTGAITHAEIKSIYAVKSGI